MAHRTDDVLRRVPQNIEAEQSVLGAILLQNEAIDWQALEILTPDDFYRETHREIFKAMTELAAAKQPIDAITLTDILRAKGILEQIGGPAYIAELADAVPTAANVGFYAERVWRMARFREFASVGTDLVSSAYEAALSIEGFFGDAESRLQKLYDKVWKLQERVPREARVTENVNVLLNGVPQGEIIQVGFPVLDSKVWLMAGDLITLAAETSLGKTSIAGNMALSVAKASGGAIFFTYEMSENQLNQRLICTLGEVSADRSMWGKYDEIDRGRINVAAEMFKELPLNVVWARGYKPRQIHTEIRRQRRELKAPLRLVVVDYLQLMQADTRNRNRDQDYDDIMSALKDFAGEFQCAVLVLSQFNREATKRSTDKHQIPPRVSDCKGSSAIEQYSDGIWLLWQPEPQFPTKMELLVGKNRNGGKCKVSLLHVPEYLRFEPRKTHGY